MYQPWRGFKTILIWSALLSLVLVGGCAQNYGGLQQEASSSCRALGPRALSGALVGGASGAAFGASLGALAGHGNRNDVMIGALAGLLMGSAIGGVEGKRLDERDCTAAQLALQKIGNQPSGAVVDWKDASTGNHGAYRVVSDKYTASSGKICRRVQASYYMHGHKPVNGDPGIICRTPQGNWVRQAPTPTT